MEHGSSVLFLSHCREALRCLSGRRAMVQFVESCGPTIKAGKIYLIKELAQTTVVNGDAVRVFGK